MRLQLSDPILNRRESDTGPSVLDLFAAPGGLSEGFRQGGCRILAAVDSDKWGCSTLNYNFGSGGTLVIEADIERVMFKGSVDIVIGGPPCQSFSMAGRPKINHLVRHNERKRFIDDVRNRLYKHFVRIVNAVRPQFLVMENVPGMISFMDGQVKDQIITDFESIGYSTDFRIINAADFGVPQIRKRAIFIGNRLGYTNPFPRRTHANSSRFQMTLEDTSYKTLPYVTVSEAISDLPHLRPGEGSDDIDYPRRTLLTPYQHWARERSTTLFNHVTRQHSARDRRLFRMLRQGQNMTDLPERLRPYRSDIFSDKMKKQRWDSQATAIVAHMQKDGLMYIHPDRNQARTFTPREAARLQSFQDRFRFLGPMTQQFKQIGNAVPPLVGAAIAASIKPMVEPLTPPLVSYQILA